MTNWSVRYLDLETNRETESQPLATRDQAVTLARARELQRCAIRSIVGPHGEEPWARVTFAASEGGTVRGHTGAIELRSTEVGAAGPIST